MGVKQTNGAGGTQVGAAGLVAEDWWALPFHNPRAICLARQSLHTGDTDAAEGRRTEDGGDRKPTDRLLAFITATAAVHLALATKAALADLARAPRCAYTAVVRCQQCLC